jgi:cytochrome P450
MTQDFPFPLGPRGCPISDYERRLAVAPLEKVRLPSGDIATFVVRYDDVVRVFSDPRFTRDLSYPGAPRLSKEGDFTNIPDVILNMDPPRHTRIRRLMAGTMTPAKIAAWRPQIRVMAEKLLDELEGPVVEFVSAVAFPFALEAIGDVMGVPGFDTERTAHWCENMLPSSGLTAEEQLASIQEFAGYCAELIQQLRDVPGEGVLQTMIQARYEGDQLNDNELITNMIGLFLAGHETTGAVVARMLLRLLEPREYYEQLVDRPELIRSAVEELLRLEVPGDGAAIRVATEDVDLPSGVIRKGEAVVASFVGPNHDDTVYERPRELRLDRDGKSHLTFGRGPHFCLGAPLARMELQEMLAAIVERLPNLTLAVPADDVEWTEGAFKRPVTLPLRLN